MKQIITIQHHRDDDISIQILADTYVAVDLVQYLIAEKLIKPDGHWFVEIPKSYTTSDNRTILGIIIAVAEKYDIDTIYRNNYGRN